MDQRINQPSFIVTFEERKLPRSAPNTFAPSSTSITGTKPLRPTTRLTLLQKPLTVMDSASAARYLQPRPFVIALAAGTVTLGDLSARAYSFLYALVADEVGLPHAVILPSSSTPSSSTKTFSDILRVVHQIPFRADAHMAQQHALHLPIARVTTVEQALRVVLDAVLRSPDGLHRATELLDPQGDPAMHGVFEPDGVISCFLRKICIAFASLTFDALSRLLHDLRLFVHPNPSSTLPSYTTRANLPPPSVTRNAALALAHGLPVESDGHFKACTTLFAESRNPTAATNLAMQSLHNLGRDRRALMALPSVEYVVQLEAQRRKDFATSIDALHRYYDLSLAEIGHESAKANARRAQQRSYGQRKEGNGMNDPQGHQYAALSLGVLHAQFGNPNYASVALDDTIRAAQHCNDEACQARALSWIARTSSSVARRHQLLRHANDQLALAREEICTVFTPVSDGVPGSVSLHSVQRGGTKQNTNGDGTLHGTIASARLTRIQNRINHRKPENRVDSLLMSAAAWESHAASPAALAVAKMALSFADRADKDRLSACKARALAAVASLTALEGDFDKAVSVLENSSKGLDAKLGQGEETKVSSTNVPETELLSRTLLWLQFERSLRQSDTSKASKLTESLTAFAECSRYNIMSFTAEDLVLDAIEARCRFQLACQASQEAAKEAESLCRRAAGFARPSRVVEGLRLRAEAQLISECYNSALPAVLAAVSLSHGLGMESAHVQSVLTLTETILRMEEQEPGTAGAHAFKALKPVLAKALGGLGAWVRARAHRLHAECLLAMTSASGAVPDDNIVELLVSAKDAYALCEDAVGMRDSLYLLARVRHWRGEERERNAAARKYRQQVSLLSRRQACLSVTRN